jgi:hypothetical protein
MNLDLLVQKVSSVYSMLYKVFLISKNVVVYGSTYFHGFRREL